VPELRALKQAALAYSKPGVVHPKTVVVKSISENFYREGCGSVKQKHGGNERSFTLVCSSTDLKDVEKDSSTIAEDKGIPLRAVSIDLQASSDQSKFCLFEIFQSSPLYKFLADHSVDALQNILRKANQTVGDNPTKEELMSRVLTLINCGVLPRCVCGGSFVKFIDNSREFQCSGHYDQNLQLPVACDRRLAVPASFPHLSSIMPDFAEKIQRLTVTARKPCNFNIQFVNHGQGFLIAETASHHPQHSNWCFTAPKAQAPTIQRVITERKLLDKDGRSTQGLGKAKSAAGLHMVPRATFAYNLKVVKEQEFKVPRQESDSKILPWLLQLSLDNPGTLVTIQVANNGANSYYEVRSGEICLLGGSFSSMVQNRLALSASQNGNIRTKVHLVKALKKRAASQPSVSEVEVRMAQVLQELVDLMRVADPAGLAEVEEQLKDDQELTKLLLRLTEADNETSPENDLIPNNESEPVWDVPVANIEFEGGTIVNLCIIFGPSMDLFRSCCKHLVYFDTAHLKDGLLASEKKGQVMIIEIEDANNRIYPLGVNLCFSESNDNYVFLFESVARAGLDLNDPKLLMLSDRGRACVSSVARYLPSVAHRYCSEHIFRNIQTKSKKLNETVKDALRVYLRATSVEEERSALERVSESLSKTALDYLAKIPREKIISESFLRRGIATYGRISSNAVESENARMRDCRRAKSTFEFLCQTVNKVSETYGKRQEEAVALLNATDMGYLLPMAATQAKLRISRSRALDVTRLSPTTYSVSMRFDASVFETKWSVDIDKMECDCGVWQDQGIPCEHAAAVKVYAKVPDEVFEEKWFSPMYCLKTYAESFKNSLIVPRWADLLGSYSEELKRPVNAVVSRGREPLEKRIKSKGEL
jgi:hypothetical protein